jgi:hypothetical protein
VLTPLPPPSLLDTVMLPLLLSLLDTAMPLPPLLLLLPLLLLKHPLKRHHHQQPHQLHFRLCNPK